MMKMTNKLPQLRLKLLSTFALIFTFNSYAQVTSTYAVGTSTSNNAPITAYYGYSYSEQIYLASDFDVAVQGQMNQIDKIRFYVNGTDMNNSTDWTVFMGATNNTEYANNTSYITSGGMSQVYSGTLPSTATAGWLEITLVTPFMWDGVSNVVIGVDENQSGYAGSNLGWRYNSTTNYRTLSYSNDYTNPNPASPPSANNRYQYVPQIQFEHTLAPACNGTPTHSSLSASSLSSCAGGTIDYTLATGTFNSGLSITWEYNNGLGWTPFSNSTSTESFSSVITETIDVRAIRTCANSSLSDISDVVTITYNPNPIVSINESNIVVCSNGTAPLTASGASTYSWSPNYSLSSVTGATVNANPTQTTIYTVIGTDVNGCSSDTTVIVTPMNEVLSSYVYTPTQICASGSPISIDISIDSTVTSNSPWQYQFLSSDGVTPIQTWSTSNNYTFTPTSDGVYNYYYKVKNTGCTDNMDSSLISFTVGFGANVVVEDYNCNNQGGIITLNSIFGHTTESLVYSDSLNVTNSDFTLTGDASITGGRTVLTPSQPSASGNLDINISNFSGGLNNAMTVKFDLTADTPINTYGTGGGDGISYSFGDDALPSSPGNNANGKGTKLRLSFDAANNSANQGGIYLIYGYTGSAAIDPADPSVLAYVPNLTSWKLQTDVPVELSISPQSTVTLKINNVIIFEGIVLPASYATENVSTWKHLFSAHTGGDALRQAIANFSVTKPTILNAVVPTGISPLPGDYSNNPVSQGLLPGWYDVHLTDSLGSSCSKFVGAFQIANLNPTVNLGNDTTICQGDILTLNAGNIGSAYSWSNSGNVLQTLQVTTSGNYVAYVTDTNACVGVGSIQVNVLQSPTIGSIFIQGNFPNISFSVINPQNTTGYSWDFGDNNSQTNAPNTISHTYATPGTYTVTLTVTNDCGTASFSENVVVNDVTGLEENSLSGLKVYPNPAKDIVTIDLPTDQKVSLKVFSVTGKLVSDLGYVNGTTKINVNNWAKGVFFITVKTMNEQTSTIRLIVD